MAPSGLRRCKRKVHLALGSTLRSNQENSHAREQTKPEHGDAARAHNRPNTEPHQRAAADTGANRVGYLAGCQEQRRARSIRTPSTSSRGRQWQIRRRAPRRQLGFARQRLSQLHPTAASRAHLRIRHRRSEKPRRQEHGIPRRPLPRSSRRRRASAIRLPRGVHRSAIGVGAFMPPLKSPTWFNIRLGSLFP